MPPRLKSREEQTRVVGYVRVSTAREEMISPELQAQAIRDYCTRRGYTLTEIIEDLDKTGRTFARAGVQRAIELVEARDVRAVIVWKFSRFGRTRTGWAVNLDRVETAGGRLESATEEVDATTSTGKFSRGMFAEIAAWESDRIGDEWRSAHQNRLDNGLPHHGQGRFGYLYHRTTMNTRGGIKVCPQGCGMGECENGYLPIPELVPFVEEMYLRYNSGEGCRAVAAWLNSCGITTRKGSQWTDRSVRIYLNTGFAAGLLRVHDTDCGCKSPQTCRNNTWRPGKHPAIVDQDVWEAHERNRDKRTTLPPRVAAPVYPLAGLVFCALCEGPLHAHTIMRGGEKVAGGMYHCALYAKSKGCPGTWIVRHALEARVLEWVKVIAAREIHEASELVIVKQAVQAAAATDRKKVLREMQDVQAALTQLTVDKAKKLIPEVAFLPARDALLKEYEILTAKLEAAAVAEEAPQGPPVQVARDLVARWLSTPSAAKRTLLALLISRTVVRSIRLGVHEIKLESAWGEVFTV